MVNLISFVIFFIGCLIAQASSGRLDERNNQLELSEDPSLPYLPFLSCALIKTKSACNVTCSLVGSIYGQPVTSGFCGEHYDCVCNILPKASLADYWNQNFDSKNILQEIRKDGTLSKKILTVLKKPFRTPQETLSNLKPLLNEKQLEDLRFKDTEAQKLFIADDKFEAVKNYVATKLKSLEKSSDSQTTRETLNNVLRSPGILYDRIRLEVRRSRNEVLNQILNQYSRNRNIQIPFYNGQDDEESLIRLLDAAVVSELIGSPAGEPFNPRGSSVKQRKFNDSASSSRARVPRSKSARQTEGCRRRRLSRTREV